MAKLPTEQVGKTKDIECVVFVPGTPGTKLRDPLQDRDDKISEVMNSPALMFVEKGGAQ